MVEQTLASCYSLSTGTVDMLTFTSKLEAIGASVSGTDFPITVQTADGFAFEIESNKKIVTLNGIALSTRNLKLLPGGKASITVMILDENINQENVELIWSSSNESIVTVDNGTVQVKTLSQNPDLQLGDSALITVMCGDYSATCNVTVVQNLNAAEDIETITIVKGVIGRLALSCTYLEDIEYITENEMIVKIIHSSGSFIGNEAGKTNIILKGKQSGETKTVKVIVREKALKNVDELTVDERKDRVLLCGTTENIIKYTAPLEEIECLSSDANIVSVEAKTGKLTAGNKAGAAKITIRGESDKVVELNVTVKKSIDSLSSSELAEMKVIEGLNENVRFNLSEYEPIDFISGNESKASINSSGVITGKEFTGNSPIAISMYGTMSKKTKSMTVSVKKPVSKLTNSELSNMNILINKTSNVPFTITDYEPLTFASSSTSYFTVNSNGVLTGVAVGDNKTLTITGNTTGVSKTISVSIRRPVESLTSTELGLITALKDKTVNVPFNVSDFEPLVLTPSSTSYFTVNSSGVITGVAVGTGQTLTVKGTTTGVIKTITVQIQRAVDSITSSEAPALTMCLNSEKYVVISASSLESYTFSIQGSGISVTSSGKVTSGSSSTSTAKVRLTGEVSGTYKDISVTVLNKVTVGTLTSTEISNAALRVGVGLSKTISINKTNLEDVTFTSNNTSYVTVSGTTATGVAVGTTTIRVTGNTSGTYKDISVTVYTPVWIAQIGTTNYESIADAISAITTTSSTTIKLLQNTTESVTIPSNRNITLNLNSKKLTMANSSGIQINGTLKLQSGTVAPYSTSYTPIKCNSRTEHSLLLH